MVEILIMVLITMLRTKQINEYTNRQALPAILQMTT